MIGVYALWTPAQRTWVHDHLISSLDMWPSFSHANVNDSDKNSNWVAVTRGAELIILLATHQEHVRSDRLSLTTNDLLTHIANGHGSQGVSQEGTGYLEYGGQFLATAVLAADDAGMDALRTAYLGHHLYRLLRYTHGFSGAQPQVFIAGRCWRQF